MAYKATENIRHNGVNFKIGQEVTGLKEEEAKRLFDLGVIQDKKAEVIQAAFQEEQKSGEIDNKDLDIAYTPEEFAALLAEDQKVELKAQGIEPASKAEDRAAQYKAWYDEQVTPDGTANPQV